MMSRPGNRWCQQAAGASGVLTPFPREAEMKKLALYLDDLKIETFATGEQSTVRGPVQAHYGANHTVQGCFSGNYTCDGWMTFQDGQQMCVAC
jgi:hypothetical protein